MNKEQNLHSITIPSELLHNKEVSANAKLLLGEIIYLCGKNKNGCCWASNNYFAELFDVSVTSISLWVSSLEKHKFIKCDVNYKNNTRKVFLNTSLRKLKDNIAKAIYSTSTFDVDVLKDNTLINSDFKIETKEWINKKGQKVGTDSIDYEEKETNEK